MLPLGLYLIYRGATKLDAPCPAAPSLAKSTVVLGIVYLATAVAIFIAAIRGICLTRQRRAGRQVADARKKNSAMSLCCLYLIFPILLWGTVVAFKDDLWTKMQDDAQAPSLCDQELYKGAAIGLIAGWSIAAFFLAFLVMCCSLVCVIVAFAVLMGAQVPEAFQQGFNTMRTASGRIVSRRGLAAATTTAGNDAVAGNGAAAPREPAAATPASAAPLLAMPSA